MFVRRAPSALVVGAASAQAAPFFTNGSLDGPIAYSLTPTGWTNLAQGTTDTISAAGHPFGGFSGIGAIPFVNSNDGGTFAWSSDYRADSAGQPEGLRQLVLNLTVGASYKISFEYANLGLYDASGDTATNAFGAGQSYNSAGRWIVKTGILEIGATPVEDYAPTAVQQVWKQFSLTFVAPAANITFGFESNWVSGTGSHVGMGIDGISIEEVPAPSAAISCILLGALTRRRR